MLLDTKTDLVDCELAWSPDTVRWDRVCPGVPLIPRGPQGSYDGGCIYAAASPIVLDGEIRLYYGGNNAPHTTWRDGFFCLARLRPDGFAAMEPVKSDTVGVIVTKPILLTGEDLRISADVAGGGSVRVGVEGESGLSVDDCEPIAANVTDGIVRWKKGRGLAPFIGKSVRLRFELRAAGLYAFAG